MNTAQFHLYSTKLCVTTQVSIVLPDIPQFGMDPKQFYSSEKKFKVLWLLHGSGSDDQSWLMNTNIARYATERNLIVVCPSALNGDYSNYTSFADGFNMWEFLTKELMPLVHGWFPASANPKDNFIAGFSMGGNGALMYALGNPQLFGGVALFSSTAREIEYLRPIAQLTAEQFRNVATLHPEQIPGPNGTGIRLKEVNAIAKYPTIAAYLDSCENAWDRLAEVAKTGSLPKMYVSCGTLDANVYPRFLRFQTYCDVLGITNATFEEFEGYRHEWALCEITIVRALDYFGLEKV